MERVTYITDEERKKCRKVADAFAELYELADVVVVDADRFGFVRLQWLNAYLEFDSAVVYSDSGELFEELWRIWYEYQVLTPVLGTEIAELDYDDIFKCLPKEKQEEIMDKRLYFAEKAGIEGIGKDEIL